MSIETPSKDQALAARIDAGCDEVVNTSSPSIPEVYNTLDIEMIQKEIASKAGMKS